MRIPAIVLAVVILIAALPLIPRLESALAAGRRGRAAFEAWRIGLAAAAIGALLVIAVRAR